MADSEKEILELLREIHRLLVPISVCFEERFEEIQHQQAGEKFKELETLLTTDLRRGIFPLLFDPRQLSQAIIAEEAGTTQPTVSRFINLLLKHDLVDQVEDEVGNMVYVDKFDLVSLMEDSK